MIESYLTGNWTLAAYSMRNLVTNIINWTQLLFIRHAKEQWKIWQPSCGQTACQLPNILARKLQRGPQPHYKTWTKLGGCWVPMRHWYDVLSLRWMADMTAIAEEPISGRLFFNTHSGYDEQYLVKWSASNSSHFTPHKRDPPSNWTVTWVSHNASRWRKEKENTLACQGLHSGNSDGS